MMVLDRKEEVAAFVSSKLRPGELLEWGGYTTVGWERNGKLVAGVVYNFYSPPNICMSVATEGDFWLTPEFLFSAFDYPFGALGLGRVTGFISSQNKSSLAFADRLGFSREGCLRRAFPDGSDMVVFGMLKEDCRWIQQPFMEKLSKRLSLRGQALAV